MAGWGHGRLSPCWWRPQTHSHFPGRFLASSQPLDTNPGGANSAEKTPQPADPGLFESGSRVRRVCTSALMRLGPRLSAQYVNGPNSPGHLARGPESSPAATSDPGAWPRPWLWGLPDGPCGPGARVPWAPPVLGQKARLKASYLSKFGGHMGAPNLFNPRRSVGPSPQGGAQEAAQGRPGGSRGSGPHLPRPESQCPGAAAAGPPRWLPHAAFLLPQL